MKKSRKWHISNLDQRIFDEEEIVRGLFAGNIVNTALIAADFPSFNILESICCLNPPRGWTATKHNPHYYNIKWKARVLQMTIENSLFNPGQDFFLEILYESDDQLFSSLYAALTSEKISDSVAQRTILDLLKLRKQRKDEIVEALQPSIAECLRKVNSRILWSCDGFSPWEILDVYKGIDVAAIQHMPSHLLNASMFQSFIMQMVLLTDQKVKESLQRLISLLEITAFKENKGNFIFPAEDPNFDALIVLNESLSTKNHFVQIQWNNAKVEITYDMNRYRTIMLEKELYPYFLVACLQRIYQKKELLNDRIKFIQKNYNVASRVSNVFKQIANDDALVAYISQSLGSRKTLEDLATKSIPLLFVNSIPKIEKSAFDPIFRYESYLISEKEMSNSESFLYASKIFYNVIEFVVGNINRIPDDLTNYLNSLSDDSIRNSLLIDLFSLIFLKDAKGNFFCNIEKAEEILRLVPYRFPDRQLINNGIRHIIFARLRGKSDLQSALISNDSLLLELLQTNQLDLAVKIFANHPRFEILVQLIISLRTSKFLNENRHLYSIELYLSKNVANDWISNIHEINSDYYSPYILDSVKYLIEHHMKYENPIDLYQKIPNHFHTTTFKEYLELYQKFQHKTDDRMDPSEIIKVIHHNEMFANMKNLTTLLGSNALEFVLIYSKEIGDQIYKLFESESPLTAQMIRYDYACNKKYEKGNSDSVYERFLQKKAGYKDDDEFEIIDSSQNQFNPTIDQADSDFMPLTRDQVEQLIDKAVSSHPISASNIELLNELYLKSPEAYLDKMNTMINSFTIPELLEIYPYCGMRSLPILDRLNVSSISITPIVELLMDTMQWNTLKLFMKDFKKIDDMYKYIYDYLNKHPEMIDITPKYLLEDVDVDMIERKEEVTEQYSNVETITDLIDYLQRNPEFEPNEAIENALRIFQNIVIDDFQKEVWTGRQIHKLLILFSKRVSTSFVTKLRALSMLISKSIYARFLVPISLSNFQSEAFGQKMASISLKYDFYQECLDFCAAYSIDISMFKAERAKAAFLLGLVDDGFEYISTSIRNDAFIDQMVDILSHTFVFDMSEVIKTENEIEMINILIKMPTAQNRWREICEGLAMVLAGSPQIQTLHKILVKLNSIDKLVMFYTISGNFEDAFDVWNTIQRNQTKSDLFIRSIVYPALISKNWNSLWFKVKKIATMKPFVNDLIKYLDQKKMGLTSYLVQMRLCMYESAYKTSAKYFRKAKSWEGQKRIAEAMKDACKKSDSLQNKMPKVEFQLYLIQQLITENVPFTNTINLYSTKENALNVAVYLLKRGEVEIVMSKLVPLMLFTLNEMCHALLDDVMQGEMGALHKFFKSIEKIDAQTYEVIVMNLFQAIKTRVADPGSLRAFIDANVRDDLKGQVFITFDFLEAAYEIAKKTNDRFLMQLILENAEKKGNESLCQKVRSDLQ